MRFGRQANHFRSDAEPCVPAHRELLLALRMRCDRVVHEGNDADDMYDASVPGWLYTGDQRVCFES